MSPIPLWLADYQLLAAALLLGVMLAIAALRQPAQRLAVAKSTLAALAALALLCALPGWSLVHLLSEPATSIESVASTPIETPSVSQNNPLLTPPQIPANITPLSPTIEPSAKPQLAVAPAKPINWPAWFTAAYATGSAAATLWLITGALFARRVRQQATPAPLELQELLQQICGPEKSPPQLLISPQITAPVALGIRRPSILLPPSALPLPSSQLLPILAHEWAHLQHRDLHTLAATRLLLILLWPQPLYWLLRRTIRLDQETLADAAAADRAGRLDYAQQLLAWASSATSQRPPRLAGAVGLWEGPSQLKRRIALLLNEQFNVMRSCSRRWRGGSLVAIALMAIGLSTVTFQPQAGVANEAGDETVKVESPATDKAEPTTETAVAESAPSDTAAEHDPMIAYLGHRQTENKTPNVIRGRCLDEANRPIADVEVELYRGKRPSGLQRLVTQTKTNAAGEFEFRNVVDPKQSFPDGVVPANYVSNTEMFTITTRQPGRVSREVLADAPYTYREGRSVDVLMPPAASLSGTVTDDAGKPIAGARVSRNGLSDFPHIFSGVTDAQGRFSIDDLAPFDLAAEKKRKEEEKKAADAQLAAGAQAVLTTSLAPRFSVVHPEFSGKRLPLSSVPSNVEVKLSPGARLRGRVLFADGSPAASTAVIVKPSVSKQGNGDWGMIDYGKFNIELDYQVTVQTDAEGRFDAGALTPGKVDVWAELPGWLNAGVGEFEVQAGPAASLPDLTLTKGGVIRLQLIDDETDGPIAVDEPLVANVSVIMKNKLGRQETWPDRKKVSDQGVVEIASVTGTAQVMLQSVESGAEQQWLPAASDWTAYPQAQVVEGQTVDAAIRVRKVLDAPPASVYGSSPKPMPATRGEAPRITTAPAPTTKAPATETRHRSIGQAGVFSVVGEPQKLPAYKPNAFTVRAVDSDAKPLSGVEVLLYRTSFADGIQQFIATATTNDDGEVDFNDLVSAEQLEEDRQREAKNLVGNNHRPFFLAALKVPGFATATVSKSSIDVGQRGAKRTVIMRPAAVLSGRVTNPQGEPVANATVAAGGMASWLAIPGVNAIMTNDDGEFRFDDRVAFARAPKQDRSASAALDLKVNSIEMESDEVPLDPAKDQEAASLIVTHPDFAMTTAVGDRIPGEVNVQLRPAASIRGRVLDYKSGDPVAGIPIHAWGMPPLDPNKPVDLSSAASHSAHTTTDANGDYELRNLPAGRYDIWAEPATAPFENRPWTSRGVSAIPAIPGNPPAKAPDLIVGPPPKLRVQLVNAETGKPLNFKTGASAQPFENLVGGPQFQNVGLHRVDVTTDGVFEMEATPGKLRLGAFVYDGEQKYPPAFQTDDSVYAAGEVLDLHLGETQEATLKVYPGELLVNLRELEQRGHKLHAEKKYAEAAEAFSEILRDHHANRDALIGRGYAYRSAGDFSRAITDFEAALASSGDDQQAEFMLADLLATSPVEGTRNGKRALGFAQRALADERNRHQYDTSGLVMMLEIVAAAYAETADFDNAMAAQREAIELAPEARKAGMQNRLELYQSNKPFRREAASPETKTPAEKPADQGASKSPSIFPLTTKAVQLPPPSLTTTRAVAVLNPTAGLTQLEALDLQFPSDATWHLIPQPVAINLNAAATLSDAVK